MVAVIATEYMLKDKEHPEFFNKRTIYSDLIDNTEKLKLVEPRGFENNNKYTRHGYGLSFFSKLEWFTRRI